MKSTKTTCQRCYAASGPGSSAAPAAQGPGALLPACSLQRARSQGWGMARAPFAAMMLFLRTSSDCDLFSRFSPLLDAMVLTRGSKTGVRRERCKATQHECGRDGSAAGNAHIKIRTRTALCVCTWGGSCNPCPRPQTAHINHLAHLVALPAKRVGAILRQVGCFISRIYLNAKRRKNEHGHDAPRPPARVHRWAAPHFDDAPHGRRPTVGRRPCGTSSPVLCGHGWLLKIQTEFLACSSAPTGSSRSQPSGRFRSLEAGGDGQMGLTERLAVRCRGVHCSILLAPASRFSSTRQH